MGIRAKFRCTAIHHHSNGSLSGPPTKEEEKSVEVEMWAVQGEENKPWSRATPQGRLAITLTNPEAFGRFTLGADYFLDIFSVETAAVREALVE